MLFLIHEMNLQVCGMLFGPLGLSKCI